MALQQSTDMQDDSFIVNDIKHNIIYSDYVHSRALHCDIMRGDIATFAELLVTGIEDESRDLMVAIIIRYATMFCKCQVKSDKHTMNLIDIMNFCACHPATLTTTQRNIMSHMISFGMDFFKKVTGYNTLDDIHAAIKVLNDIGMRIIDHPMAHEVSDDILVAVRMIDIAYLFASTDR